MRKVLVALLALVSLASASLPATAGSEGASGIKGVVVDATCYGPCRYPPPPLSPYTGPGLTVAVRSLPDNELLTRLHPEEGRFAIRLAPGWYRLKARVGQEPSCWRGGTRKAQVYPGEISRARLRVANECIR
jgi:hypothetical protein